MVDRFFGVRVNFFVWIADNLKKKLEGHAMSSYYFSGHDFVIPWADARTFGAITEGPPVVGGVGAGLW